VPRGSRTGRVMYGASVFVDTWIYQDGKRVCVASDGTLVCSFKRRSCCPVSEVQVEFASVEIPLCPC